MMKLGRRPFLVGLALVSVLVAGCGGGGGPGGPNSSDPDVGVDLIAQSTLPTNGQEVLPDLSDVDGVVQVKFSAPLARNTVLDANNAFNGLSSDVNVLDSAFARVPGTPSIAGGGNLLTFVPAGGVLPNGQYTITATRDVRSTFGARLNRGLHDFRSSFTVGTDVFSPVIRNTFPAANQTDVPKDSQIIVTFNESLNPATITNATVTIVDGGSNPPITISGQLKTSRDDFDIVFTPDPGTGLPANATIVVTLTGGSGGITDVVGNPFDGDPTTPDMYQFQFQTVVEPPPPNNPIMVDLSNLDGLVACGTQDSIVTVAEWGYGGDLFDLSTWGQSGAGVPNPIPNSRRKIGQPGEIIMDQRFGPGDGHSWMYVIDRKSRSVTIVGTRDNKVVHRWKSLPDPRGLAITRQGSQLYVTNYGADTVSILDIASVTPGASQATTALKELTDLRKPDDPGGKGRVDLQVGRGPTGAAHAPDGNFLYVANSLDNTCTRIDTGAGRLLQTWQTGTSPQDLGATFFIPINIGWFVFVTCLGGGSDEAGSVSLGWFGGIGPNDLQANIGGFQNPKGIIYDFGLGVWITNSGGDTATNAAITVAGGGFAATILPVINNSIKVGRNPSSCTIDPLGLALIGAPMTVITADRGSSQLTFIDYLRPVRPTFTLKIPGAQEVAAYWDQ